VQLSETVMAGTTILQQAFISEVWCSNLCRQQPHSAGPAVLLVFVCGFVGRETVHALGNEGRWGEMCERFAEASANGKRLAARFARDRRLATRANGFHE
jgi:hypothetical protein